MNFIAFRLKATTKNNANIRIQIHAVKGLTGYTVI